MARGPVRARRAGSRGWAPVVLVILSLALLVGLGVFWSRRRDPAVQRRAEVAPSSVVSNAPDATVLAPPEPVVDLTQAGTNSPAITNLVPVPATPSTKEISVGESPSRPGVAAVTNPPVVSRGPESGLDVFSAVPNRAPTNILEAQIVLAGLGISSGSVDGVGGYQTAQAFRAFQNSRGLEETGRLDKETQDQLRIVRPLFRRLVLQREDFEGLAPVPDTWLGKSQAPQLGFESILESVAERSHSSPTLLRKLNPGVDWSGLRPGQELVVPNAAYPSARRAALARISLEHRHLRVFDAKGNLLAHFPCSIGRIAERRPVGELQVASVVRNPNYTFNPAVFPESEEGRRLGRRLVLPAGPNNPVGVAWIGLSRAGYGIHGTPVPEMVGRTESHGCFRLANWNADYLRRMAWVGMPIWVEL